MRSFPRQVTEQQHRPVRGGGRHPASGTQRWTSRSPVDGRRRLPDDWQEDDLPAVQTSPAAATDNHLPEFCRQRRRRGRRVRSIRSQQHADDDDPDGRQQHGWLLRMVAASRRNPLHRLASADGHRRRTVSRVIAPRRWSSSRRRRRRRRLRYDFRFGKNYFRYFWCCNRCRSCSSTLSDVYRRRRRQLQSAIDVRRVAARRRRSPTAPSISKLLSPTLSSLQQQPLQQYGHRSPDGDGYIVTR